MTTAQRGQLLEAILGRTATKAVDALAPLIESWLADAWDQGQQHESDYLMTWGQFCPREIAQSANPYREDA